MRKQQETDISELPDGAFVVLDDKTRAYLVWGEQLREWSPGGRYINPLARPAKEQVTVLTPPIYREHSGGWLCA